LKPRDDYAKDVICITNSRYIVHVVHHTSLVLNKKVHNF
jgi:hypothetical protein